MDTYGRLGQQAELLCEKLAAEELAFGSHQGVSQLRREAAEPRREAALACRRHWGRRPAAPQAKIFQRVRYILQS